MSERALSQYPLRIAAELMDRVRRAAGQQGVSLNVLIATVLRGYVDQAERRRAGRRMRWVIGGEEYNTETADVVAHGGRDRHSGQRKDELFRTPDGTYFVVDEDEEDGWSITVLNERDAYQVYLALPYRLFDEDEAFGVEDEEETPTSAT